MKDVTKELERAIKDYIDKHGWDKLERVLQSKMGLKLFQVKKIYRIPGSISQITFTKTIDKSLAQDSKDTFLLQEKPDDGRWFEITEVAK